MSRNSDHVDPAGLDRLLDRELGAEESAALLLHLASCRPCAETHAPLIEAVRLLELPKGLAPAPPLPRPVLVRRWVAAASLLLLIPVALWALRRNADDGTTPPTLVRPTSLSPLDPLLSLRVREVTVSATGLRTRCWETETGGRISESDESSTASPIVEARLTVRSSKKGNLR